MTTIKKTYEKPSVMVYRLKTQSTLLAGSPRPRRARGNHHRAVVKGGIALNEQKIRAHRLVGSDFFRTFAGSMTDEQIEAK